MRQAGRSLPEYRRLREGVSMLDSCRQPDLVVEITMQPVRRHGVDAAIFFSDIVVPLKAIGVDLDIKPGVGPVVAAPMRRPADLDVPTVAGAGRRALRGRVRGPAGRGAGAGARSSASPGAPFTLASYLVEGGPSRNHEHTKALMYGDEATWHLLMERLSDIALAHLRVQVTAGASAVQLFDSWVGALPAADYERYVMPHSRRIFEGLADLGVPRIHFGVNTGELLGLMADAGADVVGVDYRVPLDVAASRVGPGKALQGNLDPAVTFAPWDAVADRTRQVLADAGELPGHVFNLGHGVLPATDPDVLSRIVDLVHAETAD